MSHCLLMINPMLTMEKIERPYSDSTVFEVTPSEEEKKSIKNKVCPPECAPETFAKGLSN